MQARASSSDFAQVCDYLGGDPLARKQGRNTWRITGDRLARDPPDSVIERNHFRLAKEGFARRNDAAL